MINLRSELFCFVQRNRLNQIKQINHQTVENQIRNLFTASNTQSIHSNIFDQALSQIASIFIKIAYQSQMVLKPTKNFVAFISIAQYISFDAKDQFSQQLLNRFCECCIQVLKIQTMAEIGKIYRDSVDSAIIKDIYDNVILKICGQSFLSDCHIFGISVHQGKESIYQLLMHNIIEKGNHTDQKEVNYHFILISVSFYILAKHFEFKNRQPVMDNLVSKYEKSSKARAYSIKLRVGQIIQFYNNSVLQICENTPQMTDALEYIEVHQNLVSDLITKSVQTEETILDNIPPSLDC